MFALVVDGKIKVGPRVWLYTAFADALAEMNIAYELPLLAPTEPIVTEQFAILPAKIVETTPFEDPYEQPAGPFWTILPDVVEGRMDAVPTNLDFAKGRLKGNVTATRYDKEVSGITYKFSDNEEVEIYTDRERKRSYMDNIITMSDTDVITFKFKNGIFKSVTKQNLIDIVSAINVWIETCFAWEASKYAEIDACTDMENLKKVSLTFPGESNAS